MEATAYIARRVVKGVTHNGDTIDIVVAVGTPFEDKTYDSRACPVKVEGLYGQLADQHGIESWQALCLSQKRVMSIRVASSIFSARMRSSLSMKFRKFSNCS